MIIFFIISYTLYPILREKCLVSITTITYYITIIIIITAITIVPNSNNYVYIVLATNVYSWQPKMTIIIVIITIK